MMYGFGDDQNPYTESVDLLEDLVIEFITETTHRAMEIGRTGRVQVEDIVFLVRDFALFALWLWGHCNLRYVCCQVRKDQRKYARVKDLLTMNEELKRARKAFDEIKYVGTFHRVVDSGLGLYRRTKVIVNFEFYFQEAKQNKSKFNRVDVNSISRFFNVIMFGGNWRCKGKISFNLVNHNN